MVSLTFKTKKPFTGRIYVRGLADDERCSQNFASNVDQKKFSMTVQNDDCTMQRQRITGNTEGIMFSITIVISFHSTFVTRVDRAFRCVCFYRNIKRLTSGIDISLISTTELMDTVQMPTCTYSIHSGSAEGPKAIYGQVGEKIYHVWECDDNTQGFLVHSCFVNDGRGTRFDLLDLDGCTLDPVIQPDVQYDSDLTRAVAETLGYKFSDTSIMNYQCVVELCKKATGECEGLTPPSCANFKRLRRGLRASTLNTSLRRKSREISEIRNIHRMDLVATLSMLDNIEESSIADAQQPNDLIIKAEKVKI
ncbi:unnamed protein product [Thelazia callipaeda]|uniref:ZP domain-containing protein n=1 Tax=Thelazia callipaeda TaxID=103827 RepID=A0A0N5D3V0_THECL|nr:unnamed protein product [Thelazia callipaeda]